MLNQEILEYLLKRQRKHIVQECRTLAVVGASPDPTSTSYVQIEKLLAFGLSIRPILPGCHRFLGVTCYDSLMHIPEPIDILLAFSDQPVDLEGTAREAGDKAIGAFWMEEGELSADIKAILARGRVQVIEHESLAADYSRHFPFDADPGRASGGRKAVTVGERMTRHPVTIKRTDTISVALERMKTGHFHHLPLVDENGGVIGILSERDLRLVHSSLAFVSGTNPENGISSTPVEQAAFFDPVTTNPAETLERAAETMLRWKIGALPVVGNGNRLAGIITHSDLLREFVARGQANR